ncbi:MAG: Flp family type IVb pilin [Maritimibacter sp.]
MQKIFERFISEEEGNAVVDWVVLVAGVMVLSLSVVLTLTGGVENLSDKTVDQLEEIEDFDLS